MSITESEYAKTPQQRRRQLPSTRAVILVILGISALAYAILIGLKVSLLAIILPAIASTLSALVFLGVPVLVALINYLIVAAVVTVIMIALSFLLG